MVYVDPERCMGCLSCYLACAVEHSESKSIYTAPFEWPPPIPRIRVLPIDSYYIPVRCLHCDKAPCMNACPVGAITKTSEGFILVDPRKCIGCLMCAMVCPIGHPRYSILLRSMVKCDFCYERVEKGLPPACVEACPTGALRFGRVEEVMKEVSKEKAKAILSGKPVEGLLAVKPVKLETAEERKEVTPKISDIFNLYKPVSWVRG